MILVLLKTLNGNVLKVGNIFFKTNNTFPKSHCPHRNQMIFYILLCLLTQCQSLSFFSLDPCGLLPLTNLFSLLPWRHASACCYVHPFPPLHWTIKDAQWWQEHVMSRWDDFFCVLTIQLILDIPMCLKPIGMASRQWRKMLNARCMKLGTT